MKTIKRTVPAFFQHFSCCCKRTAGVSKTFEGQVVLVYEALNEGSKLECTAEQVQILILTE